METTNNHKIVKNNKKIYTFEGTRLVVTDVTKRKEYIGLLNKLQDTRLDLESSLSTIDNIVSENEFLKERLIELDKNLNEIIKIGLLDYTIINLMKEGN